MVKQSSGLSRVYVGVVVRLGTCELLEVSTSKRAVENKIRKVLDIPESVTLSDYQMELESSRTRRLDDVPAWLDVDVDSVVLDKISVRRSR